MFIIWDVGACKSKSSRIIRKISDILRSDIALALIYCSNPGELPADLNDLNYSFRTILRFGIECKYDAIVDSTRFIANTKKYTLVVISDEFSLWLYMILINPPDILYIISNNSITESIEISLLPERITVFYLPFEDIMADGKKFQRVERNLRNNTRGKSAPGYKDKIKEEFDSASSS